MGVVTEDKEFKLNCGKRLRECREACGYTQAKLSELIMERSENRDKGRSEKQISYIESGKRAFSIEYSQLISKVLNVRVEYLLMEDNYKTEWERISSITYGKCEVDELISRLMALHGYEIEAIEDGGYKRLQFPPDLSAEDIVARAEHQKPISMYVIKSPSGEIRKIEADAFMRIFESIDSYIEFQFMSCFKRPFTDYIHTRKGGKDNG